MAVNGSSSLPQADYRPRQWAQLAWVTLVMLACVSACKPSTQPATVPALTSTQTVKSAVPATITATRLPAPTQSSTPTVHPTSTRTPLPTPTPTLPPHTRIPEVYESVTPIATPASSASRYHLRSWSETEAQMLVARLEAFAAANNYIVPSHVRTGYQDGERAIVIVGREALARFPSMAASQAIRWKVALADSVVSRGASPSDVWIMETLEQGLNSGTFALDDLPRVVWDQAFEIRQSADAPNLLGDGQPARVYRLTTQEGGSDGLYFAAVGAAPGAYRLLPINASWEFDLGSHEDFQVGDHTRDGLPEVVLSLGDQSGSMCFSNLAIYQWQTDHFRDVSRGPGITDGIGASWDCGVTWHYEQPDAGGADRIVTSSFIAGEGVATTTRYYWAGERYELLEYVVQPAPGDLEPSALPYLLESGDFDELEVGSKELIGQWPLPYQEWRGPNFSDYLRFQLALSFVHRSQPAQALAVLEDLSLHPSSPLTPTVASAARAYLDSYQGDPDAYRACLAALTIMQKAIGNYPDDYGFIPNETALAAWGYLPPNFRNTGLCSLRAAMWQIVGRVKSSEFNQLPARLEELGVPISASNHLDLNADGQPEWLLLTPGIGAHRFDLWVFLQQGGRISAVPTAPLGEAYYLPRQTGITVPLTVETPPLPGIAQPVILVQAPGLVFSFYIRPIGDAWVATNAGASAIGASGYALRPEGVDTVLDIQHESERCRHCTATYRWSADSAYFEQIADVSRDAPSPVVDAAKEAERLIFEQGEYAAAEKVLESALARSQYPDEAAHLQYLLGLAHELQGEQDAAVVNYWRLWHDYPGTAYAVAAEAKLKPLPGSQ